MRIFECAFGATLILILLPTVFAQENSDEEQVGCFTGYDGAPRIEDCSSLLNEFANSQDGFNRIFDEEQLRSDRNKNWQGLVNVGAEQRQNVVQLPRVYSRGMPQEPQKHLDQRPRLGKKREVLLTRERELQLSHHYLCRIFG